MRVVPSKIIQAAVGLAIFSIIRSGLWISGSGGSGVLIARRGNGEWSSPTGLLIQTSNIPFSDRVDVYDCIMIINDHQTLKAFEKARITIGNDVNAFLGSVDAMEFDETCKDAK